MEEKSLCELNEYHSYSTIIIIISLFYICMSAVLSYLVVISINYSAFYCVAG
jgi:hypothetical protein